jgi:hypothetical protein
MEKIIFTNSNGQSIEFGSGKPYILQSLSGVGGIETEVYMEKSPFQDGSTYLDTGLNPRVISLEAAIIGKNDSDLYNKRHRLLNILNPKLGRGKLTYIYDGGKKEIECMIDASPVFPKGIENKGTAFQRTMFSILCPSPFWQDIFYEGHELSYLMGGISFPLHLSANFSYRGRRKKLMNKGDVTTPIRIEFYGPASNPSIINETINEFIKVNKELEEDEILIVDTSFGNKKVMIQKGDKTIENAFGYIDLDSSFWQLAVGKNIIRYTSDDDSEKARVKISYKNRYIGV